MSIWVFDVDGVLPQVMGLGDDQVGQLEVGPVQHVVVGVQLQVVGLGQDRAGHL